MTAPEDVLRSLVEQLKVSEERLRVQVEALGHVVRVLGEMDEALRGEGRHAYASLLEAQQAVVRLAVAEVEHGITSWRRDVHRSMEITQPIDVP